jgi:hypothetical protein
MNEIRMTKFQNMFDIKNFWDYNSNIWKNMPDKYLNNKEYILSKNYN